MPMTDNSEAGAVGVVVIGRSKHQILPDTKVPSPFRTFNVLGSEGRR